MNLTYTCSGCIWEDDCRAEDLCCEECSHYYNEDYEISQLANIYFDEIAEHADDYNELVEEMQS